MRITIQMLPGVLARLNLRKLEWAGIILPLAFLLIFHYVYQGPGHDLFHSAWGFPILVASLGLAITVFSRLMFSIIRGLQSDLERASSRGGQSEHPAKGTQRSQPGSVR